MKLIRSITSSDLNAVKLFDNDRAKDSKPCRVSVVYGPNGAGKTTFGNQIQSVDEESKSWEIVEDSAVLAKFSKVDVRLFNENFITDKLRFKDRGEEVNNLQAVALFGAQVELESEIESTLASINDKEIEVDELNKEFAKLDGKNGEVEVSKKKFKESVKDRTNWHEHVGLARGVTTPHIKPKELSNFSESQSQLKQARDAQSQAENSLNLETLANEIDEVRRKYEDANSGSYIADSLIEYALDVNLDELRQKLLDVPKVSIESDLSKKMDLLMKESNGQAALKIAEHAFLQNDLDFCPTCIRQLEDGYKKKLVTALEQLYRSGERETFINELGEYDRFASVGTFDDLNQSLSALDLDESTFRPPVDEFQNPVSQLKQLIGRKLESPETAMEWDKEAFLTKLDLYNKAILGINVAIKEYNQNLMDKSKTAERLESLAFISAMSDSEVSKKFDEYVEKDVRRTELQNQLIGKAERELSALARKVDNLRASQKNFNLGMDLINGYLTSIFADSDRLSIELSDAGAGFAVLSRGVPVPCSRLSTGERNIIALAYFFTSCLAGSDVSNLYKGRFLFVLDDPLSSFDADNKYGVLVFLRQIISKFMTHSEAQFLILTHDIAFAQDMYKIATLINGATICFSELCQRRLIFQNVSSFNGYQAILSKIYNFSILESEDLGTRSSIQDIPSGNEMRQLLEAFAEFQVGKKMVELPQLKISRSILDKASLDLSAYLAAPMFKLILHGESHMEEAVRSGMLEPLPAIGLPERQILCRELLCLIHHLSEIHIPARLGLGFGSSSFNEYEDRIVEWSAAIEKRKLT